MDGLSWLDGAPAPEAEAALFRCCGCAGWARALAASRPFGTRDALLASARREWARASREDRLEAFSHHPRIGDRKSLQARFPATHKWSTDEQRGASDADERLLDDLEAANRAYEARFGHVFIVCATGKTAAEMLALLRARLANGASEELEIAAEEQMKITLLRLDKLLSEHSGGSRS